MKTEYNETTVTIKLSIEATLSGHRITIAPRKSKKTKFPDLNWLTSDNWWPAAIPVNFKQIFNLNEKKIQNKKKS